jgi:hypothetical protein
MHIGASEWCILTNDPKEEGLVTIEAGYGREDIVIKKSSLLFTYAYKVNAKKSGFLKEFLELYEHPHTKADLFERLNILFRMIQAYKIKEDSRHA